MRREKSIRAGDVIAAISFFGQAVTFRTFLHDIYFRILAEFLL